MDKACFDKIWDVVIYKAYSEIEKRVGGVICSPDAKASIFSYYTELIAHAKLREMSPETERLNRHKVAAAMMIAILKTKPIKKVDPNFYQLDRNGEPVVWPFNESLAITTALSILCAYIMERVDEAFPSSGESVSKQIFETVCKEDREIFKDGVPISEKEREEWEWELYQIRQDGAYNLLILAHLLSYMEKDARSRYFLAHPELEPTRPKFEK